MAVFVRKRNKVIIIVVIPISIRKKHTFLLNDQMIPRMKEQNIMSMKYVRLYISMLNIYFTIQVSWRDFMVGVRYL